MAMFISPTQTTIEFRSWTYRQTPGAFEAGAKYSYITVKTSDGTEFSVIPSISGDTLTFSHSINFANNANYIVTIPVGAVKDASGDLLANQYAFSFTTAVPSTAYASLKGGVYYGTQNVILAMSAEGYIYYTTDGTDPTTTSAKYTVPLAIDKTTTLKFIAVDIYENSSEIYKEVYSILVYGDVNGDRIVGEDDSNKVKKIILGTGDTNLSDSERFAIDVDGDGKITSDDYALIKRKQKGNIDKFPVEK